MAMVAKLDRVVFLGSLTHIRVPATSTEKTFPPKTGHRVQAVYCVGIMPTQKVHIDTRTDSKKPKRNYKQHISLSCG